MTSWVGLVGRLLSRPQEVRGRGEKPWVLQRVLFRDPGFCAPGDKHKTKAEILQNTHIQGVTA